MTGSILTHPDDDELAEEQERMEAEAFKVWIREVDLAIGKLCFGLSHSDLPDKTWRDWYDDDLDAEEAAEMCLEDEGFYD